MNDVSSLLDNLKTLSMDNPMIILMNQPPEVHNIVKVPLHITGKMSIIEKSQEGGRIIAGYASVIEIDSDEQYIPKETLEKGIETLLSDMDYANIMLTHSNIQVGKILESYGDLKTHVDEKGLFIIAQIRKDLNIANDLWDKILNGDLSGFSISAEVELDHDECNESGCINVIDKMNMFEISVCSEPKNESSGFVVIEKSSTEEECEECNNKGDSMARKKKVEKAVEEPKEEVIEEAKEEIVEETVEEKAETEDKEEVVEEKSEDKSTEETVEKSENDIIIENLSKEIENLKSVVDNLIKSNEDSEETAEVKETVEEKATDEEEEVEDEEDDEEDEEEEIIEESEDEPEVEYTTKSEFDEMKKSIDELTKTIQDSLKLDEVMTIVKSKGDELAAISDRLKVVEKSEDEPKVKVDKELKDTSVEESNIIRDKLRPGTFYREIE